MTGNFGSATEQFSIGVTAGVPYNFSTSLSDLQRAAIIAKEYQHYRITGVEMRFKPIYTVHQGLGPSTLPTLYWVLDKAGTLGSLSAPQFEQLGARQVRFDKGVLVRKWKPAVVTASANTIMAGQFKTSPWLPIENPATSGLNVPKHYGCAFLIGKMSPTDATVYDVDIVVHIQFKRPYVVTPQGTANEPPRLAGAGTELDNGPK